MRYPTIDRYLNFSPTDELRRDPQTSTLIRTCAVSESFSRSMVRLLYSFLYLCI